MEQNKWFMDMLQSWWVSHTNGELVSELKAEKPGQKMKTITEEFSVKMGMIRGNAKLNPTTQNGVRTYFIDRIQEKRNSVSPVVISWGYLLEEDEQPKETWALQVRLEVWDQYAKQMQRDRFATWAEGKKDKLNSDGYILADGKTCFYKNIVTYDGTKYTPEYSTDGDEIYKNIETAMFCMRQLYLEINAQLAEIEIEDMILNGGCRQIVFTGAPGTGKTFIATKIAERLAYTGDVNKKGLVKKVQFHPSYDYTDFVEGLRPVVVSADDQVSFVKIDGTFKKFCREVAKLNAVPNSDNEKRLHFFIIDEINRANLSKVFGELMFCLETDKRGQSVLTQYNNLPTYEEQEISVPVSVPEETIETEKTETLAQTVTSMLNETSSQTRTIKVWKKMEEDIFSEEAEGFFIPGNVVIIGSMNDIDRSVDSMDFALRRRFEWKEFEVTESMLYGAFTATKKVEPKDGETVYIYGEFIANHAGDLTQRVMALNEVISELGQQYGLDRHYYISQGQFANLSFTVNDDEKDDDAFARLIQYVWDYRIRTLLLEYLRGEVAVDEFMDSARKAFVKTGEE